MTDKLPPEIENLIARESKSYSEDATLKEVVRRRVESAVALGLPAKSGAPKSFATGASAVAAKGIAAPFVALIGVGAFAAGVAVGVSVDALRSPPPPIAASVPSSTIAPPIESTAPQEAPSSSAAPVVPSAHSANPNANDDSPSSTGDLIRERELIDVAQSAMAHGRPLDAIAAAKRHQHRFPKGFLVEEREVIWIQALVATGDYDQAKAHAITFHRNFPHSALSGAVDASMQEINSATNVTDSGSP